MKKQNPICPCVDCLTYSMCKNMVKYSKTNTLTILRNRCELLNDYITESIDVHDYDSYCISKYNIFKKRLDETFEIFKVLKEE